LERTIEVSENPTFEEVHFRSETEVHGRAQMAEPISSSGNDDFDVRSYAIHCRRGCQVTGREMVLAHWAGIRGVMAESRPFAHKVAMPALPAKLSPQ
jgi:hypothetical protein